MQIAQINLKAADLHPSKFGKFFRVIKTFDNAVRVVPCDAQSDQDYYDLYFMDVNLYEWKDEEWRDYCKPKKAL